MECHVSYMDTDNLSVLLFMIQCLMLFCDLGSQFFSIIHFVTRTLRTKLVSVDVRNVIVCLSSFQFALFSISIDSSFQSFATQFSDSNHLAKILELALFTIVSRHCAKINIVEWDIKTLPTRFPGSITVTY